MMRDFQVSPIPYVSKFCELRLGLGLGLTRGGGGSSGPAVYVSDSFTNAGGSNVTLVGWTPEIGQPWALVTGATDNGQVATTDTVVATSTTGNYYVNPVTIPSANYKVKGRIATSGTTFEAPGLLAGFKQSAIDGYRVYYHNTNNLYGFQRATGGTFTTLGEVGPGASFAGSARDISLTRYVLSDRVRLLLRDEATGLVYACDDVSAARKTAAEYPGLGLRQSATIDNFSAESAPAPSDGTFLIPDGMWTWYNDPRVIVSGGNVYIGSVTGLTSGGDVQITRLATGSTLTTQLINNLQIDDHNNPGLVVLPGGKIAAFYSHHSGDATGMRYRVSTNALPDTSSFATEVQVANGGTATGYCQVSLLNDGIVRVVQRSGNGSERPWQFVKATATDVEAGTASWTRTTIIQNASARPYVLSYQTAADRIDFLVTNGHPNETATNLYHFYMKLTGTTEKWYKSDGTEITTLPISVDSTTTTLIQNTTGGRCWNWSLKLGADGHPRVLATRYPTSTGARDVPFLDIEYWLYRWTGSAWTGFRIATGQPSIYPNENHYAGGLCFDGNTTDRIYMALAVNGIYEISEWSVDESAQTVSKVRQITANSSAHNIRPYSPEGYVDQGVFWCSGGYLTYQSYEMGLRNALGGSPVEPPPPPSPPANSSIPTITGTAEQGQTLTAGNGTWTNTPTSYAYQWKADGVNISGATSGTYLLTASEVGKVITVTVTASNAGGSASATSNATAAVTAPSVWAPTSWSNLVAWWDFNDNATVFSDTGGTTQATAGSSNIGRVSDKKGSAHLTEATTQPAYVTDGSRKVAQFTQSSVHKLTSADATLAAVADGNDNAWAMVAAVKRTTGATLTADIAAFVRKGVQNDRHRIAGITTTGRVASIRTANSVDVSADTNPATPMSGTGSWAIITVVFAGTSVTARVNGSVVLNAVAVDTAAVTINEFVMGAYYVHTTGLYQNGWQGRIGEMMVADESSVTSNVTAAESYLADRFGVTLA